MSIIENIKKDKGNSFISINEKFDTNKKAIAIKDNIVTKDLPTTCASKVLNGYNSPFNATLIDRLLKNGYDIVGKTNCDEFAMGTTGQTSAFSKTEHPWLKDCYPGGSSSGSAYAVAKGLVEVSLGTDTGGSVRVPATLCNVIGFKPTYGLVPRFGMVLFTSSFDTIGIFGKNFSNVNEVLDIIKGKTSEDVMMFSEEEIEEKYNDVKSLDKLKVCYLKKWFEEEGINDKVKEESQKTLNLIGKKYELSSEEVKYSELSFALYIVLAYSEAYSNFLKFDGLRFGEGEEKEYEILIKEMRDKFGTEVISRLTMSSVFLSSKNFKEYYEKALKLRKKISEEFERIFSEYDIILAPSIPMLKIETQEENTTGQLSDKFMIPANLAGIPSLTVPLKKEQDDSPISMQVMGPKLSDKTVLAFGEYIEGLNE